MPCHHPWSVTPAEARALQDTLRGRVETSDRLGRVERPAGVDVGFDRGAQTASACVAVLDPDTLKPVEYATARSPITFPYIPGLLSFREIPVILKALASLPTPPDLLFCDGQGIAHPRRLGIASHLGVLTGLPSVGVAKTRLIGTHGDVPLSKGTWTPLMDGDETIGAVLRTRTGVKPLYISPGHRVSLATAIRLVMGCVTRYRLPETTRWAHRLAEEGKALAEGLHFRPRIDLK